MPTLQFKIQLKNIQKPPVWRRLLVNGNTTFHRFHEIIQVAFGWDNYHLYQFSPKGWGSGLMISTPDPEDDYEPVTDSTLTKLSEIFTAPKQTYVYIYDFGDDWQHQVTLEAIADQIIMHPACTVGKGACPPEDCGGPWGYINLLETLENPKHPDHKELRKWLGFKKGQQWDVNYFDITAVNELLQMQP